MVAIDDLVWWQGELQDGSRDWDSFEIYRVIRDILDYLIAKENETPASE